MSMLIEAIKVVTMSDSKQISLLTAASLSAYAAGAGDKPVKEAPLIQHMRKVVRHDNSAIVDQIGVFMQRDITITGSRGGEKTRIAEAVVKYDYDFMGGELHRRISSGNITEADVTNKTIQALREMGVIINRNRFMGFKSTSLPQAESEALPAPIQGELFKNEVA